MSLDGRAVLDAQDIRVEFGGLVAVDNVSFNIPEGSIVSLIGPNGAGKTTFFNVLTGLYKPTSGAVIFDNVEITGDPVHEIASGGMARTFQNIRLFPICQRWKTSWWALMRTVRPAWSVRSSVFREAVVKSLKAVSVLMNY